MTPDPLDPTALHDPQQSAGVVKMYPSGYYVDITKPDSALIDIRDIAHHLSLINRFNGGTAEPISVAYHSVAVSDAALMLSKGDSYVGLCALLHDTAEAYLGDWVRPMKRMPELAYIYEGLEKLIDEAVRIRFGLGHGWSKHPTIIRADNEVGEWETTNGRYAKGLHLSYEPKAVEQLFLDRFKTLAREAGL